MTANDLAYTPTAGRDGGVIDRGNGVLRCWVYFRSASGANGGVRQCFGIGPCTSATDCRQGDAGVYVDVLRAQVERGAVATAYQKVTTVHDVTEDGVADCPHLRFDGVDDMLGLTTPFGGQDAATLAVGHDAACPPRSATEGLVIGGGEARVAKTAATGLRLQRAGPGHLREFATPSVPGAQVDILRLSGGQATAWRNGRAAAQVHAAGTIAPLGAMTHLFSDGTRPSAGTLYGAILLGGAITDAARAEIDAFLAARTGV